MNPSSPRLRIHLPRRIEAAFGRPMGVPARSPLRRLADLLTHAYEHSSYWRSALATSGLDTSDLRADPAKALQCLPILTRADLVAHLDQVVVSGLDPAPLPSRRTSGSSGVPLRLPCTPAEMGMDSLLWLGAYRARGLQPWHRQAKLTHAVEQMRPARWPRRPCLFPRWEIPAAAPVAEKVRLLQGLRPQALFGWGSLLDELCRAWDAGAPAPRLLRVFSSSDMLWPSVRERLVALTGAKVFDLYGSEEAGPVAAEPVSGGGYQVLEHAVWLEVVDAEGRAADEGMAVVTVLWRRAVPLLRYALGDRVRVAARDEDGRVTRLAGLEGRQQDLFELPDGSHLSSGVLESMLYGVPGIRAFQLIETAPGQILLLVQPDTGFSAETLGQIRTNLQRRFGDRFTLGIRPVADLVRSPRTKLAPFLNRARWERIQSEGVGLPEELFGW